MAGSWNFSAGMKFIHSEVLCPRRFLMQKNKIIEVQRKYAPQLVKAAIELEAIKLSPLKPFQWASGYKMPIYNDNRRFLAMPEMRRLIAQAFSELLTAVGFSPGWIAGTATAGIPHSVTLADLLSLPVSYIRSSEKDHGLHNVIEGLGAGADYKKANVLVVEDLISTGGSSIKAVNAVRAANGNAPYCFAIFSYGLEAAVKAFSEMSPACVPVTIINYDFLLAEASAAGFITDSGKESLIEWKLDPFNWGKKHGFPPV